VGPFFYDIPDPERSLYWFAFNCGKRGVTLNLETADGRSLFRRLVEGADVVLESYRPGYLDGLSLGYDDLSRVNPSVIMTSITGFGQTGPYREYKAPDIVVWALSGNANVTGDPDRAPLAPSFPLAHATGAALQAFVGTMVALYHRVTLGHGQHVDVIAHLSSTKTVAMDPFAVWEQDKTILRRPGRSFLRPLVRPGSETMWLRTPLLYRCQDGDICFPLQSGGALGSSTNACARWLESEGMAGETLKKIDWVHVNIETIGQAVVDECNVDFSRFFETRTKAELLEGARTRGIMLSPVFTPKDILEFQQLASRDYWTRIEHPELDATITYPGPFVKTEVSSCRVRRRAPLIGEHNEEIYCVEMGLSRHELVVLKQSGVI
jgi:crotonobetainyl-CoA:carnitine CoA-transferase CaiB-like acyl-CoA transferase